jgi:hypothetical protein
MDQAELAPPSPAPNHPDGAKLTGLEPAIDFMQRIAQWIV